METMAATVMVCDYAQVHAGKLYVTGAGINLMYTQQAEAPHGINVSAAALITVPWTAHNQLHRIKISLVSEDGRQVHIAEPAPGAKVDAADDGSVVGEFNVGRAAQLQAGDESLVPLSFPLNVGLPSLGGYSVVLEVDGTELARAKFRVFHVSQLRGA